MLNAIEILHQNGICHRDFKPENVIFVGSTYDLKLIDFGFTVKFLNENNEKKKLKIDKKTKLLINLLNKNIFYTISYKDLKPRTNLCFKNSFDVGHVKTIYI